METEKEAVFKTQPLECAKLAHEIKNSLHLTRSTLKLIETDIPKVKEHDYWSSVYEELDFICSIVNDFTALNSMANHEFLPMDLGEILEEVCEKFTPLLIQNNISLKLTIPKEILHICGDEIKLQECFGNLIKNAIEAMDKDNGQINVSVEIIGSKAKVIIEDNGAGIPEDTLSQIFKLYYTTKENGTGLGLAIIQGIIAQHNGTYEVYSEPGKGTVFNLYFPLNNY